jgi:ribosomal protein L13E
MPPRDHKLKRLSAAAETRLADDHKSGRGYKVEDVDTLLAPFSLTPAKRMEVKMRIGRGETIPSILAAMRIS